MAFTFKLRGVAGSFDCENKSSICFQKDGYEIVEVYNIIRGLCLYCIKYHTIGCFGQEMKTFILTGNITSGFKILQNEHTYYDRTREDHVYSDSRKFANIANGFSPLIRDRIYPKEVKYICMVCEEKNSPKYLKYSDFAHNVFFSFARNKYLRDEHELPGKWSNICSRCHYVTSNIESSPYLSDRLDVISKPHYWGICTKKLIYVFQKLSELESGKYHFMYELMSKNIYHPGSLVLILRFSQSCFDKLGNCFPGQEYFIFKHPLMKKYAIGEYIEYDRVARYFTHKNQSIDMQDDLRVFKTFVKLLCPTLKDSLIHVKKLHKDGKKCFCSDLSRFRDNIQKMDNNIKLIMSSMYSRHFSATRGIAQKRVWSLQELSAFFITSHFYNNLSNVYNLLPTRIMEYLKQVYVQKLGIWEAFEHPGRFQVSGFHFPYIAPTEKEVKDWRIQLEEHAAENELINKLYLLTTK